MSASQDWVPPTPDEVRALRARHGLTQAQLADLAHVGVRRAQRWEAPEKTLGHSPPCRQTWELVLIRVGERPGRMLRKTKGRG